jgi:hypothetical protein
MRGRIVRSFLTAALALGMLIGLPGNSSAHQPIRFEDHQIYISCFDPLLTNGSDSAGVVVGTSDAFGDNATLAYWRAPASPETDPPTLFSGEGGTVEATLSHIEATIPLFEGDPGLPAGSATVVADLAPDGSDPFTGSTTHDGNFMFRDESVVQGLIVTEGTVTLTTGDVTTTFDLAGCPGADAQFRSFESQPDARVHDFRDFNLACQIESEDAILFLFGSTQGFVDVNFDSQSGALFSEGPGEGTFTEQGIDWATPMASQATGESVGDATIQATFTPTGEEIAFEIRTSSARIKVSGDSFDVAGEITLPATPPAPPQTFDMSSCVAVDLRDRGVETSPSGPKAGGPVPSNDLPSGAIRLLPGRTLNTQTRGATPAPEEPCISDFGEGPFEVPIENTVWYRVTGTGQTMTVDTRGSDFDTIVGLYTLDGGSFTQIACVDDVAVEPIGFTLQSRASFETVAGRTYYVQVGGFQEGEQNPSSPFGRLRIAVS